jgi:hypothetical protein
MWSKGMSAFCPPGLSNGHKSTSNEHFEILSAELQGISAKVGDVPTLQTIFHCILSF